VTVRDIDLAWLAGLWDGEGSVGVTHSYATGRLTLIPQIQIHMTHEPTVARAADILRNLGATAVTYRAREKATHHKDSYIFAVRRTVWLRDISAALLAYSITKREQWALLLELCEARIARQGSVQANGWLRRGGPPGSSTPYTARELKIGELLRAMNARPTPSTTTTDRISA